MPSCPSSVGARLAASASVQKETRMPAEVASEPTTTTRPLPLARTSEASRLLQRIRNEAHRFAICYNRKLRRRRTLSSELADIPGIGPRRQRVLLSHFGSVKAIRRATAEDIAAVPG
ncbi:MAG: helix-hairpin-helix domain-containing protein, partial [Gammaproteobacteria bacterium]